MTYLQLVGSDITYHNGQFPNEHGGGTERISPDALRKSCGPKAARRGLSAQHMTSTYIEVAQHSHSCPRILYQFESSFHRNGTRGCPPGKSG